MPWNEVSVMDQRREFVRLALQEGTNRRELCRRFGISPDVGYKWLRRWQAGDHELADQPRRPKRMPKRSEPAVWRRRFWLCVTSIQPGVRARLPIA
ncbi:transposase-like protein [Bradyrhizobium sp. F1.13.1]